MDNDAVPLLREIRDLLQRTVSNQEQVLRANEESMQLYRAASRRQVVGIVAALVVVALFLYMASR